LEGTLVDADLGPVLDLLAEEIDTMNVRELPPDMRDYQRRVATGFLERFAHMATPGQDRFEDTDRLRQPPVRGRQHFGDEVVSGGIVGRALVNRYLPQHVRGDTRYTVDEQLPEEGLHAAIVPAPVARGRLVEIDDSSCGDDRDYVGMVTAADVPGSNWQGHMVHPLAEEEILCAETITHFGQPVAVALARTRAAAGGPGGGGGGGGVWGGGGACRAGGGAAAQRRGSGGGPGGAGGWAGGAGGTTRPPFESRLPPLPT